jgi:hypothetical protein
MPTYKVTVTITSPPTNVAVRINNDKITMGRDGTGAWSGTANLDLPLSFPIGVAATGIAGMKWSTEIKVDPPAPAAHPTADYKHDETSTNVIDVFHDKITLV